MPIYEYLNSKTGKVEEHFRSVERRDCVEPHLKRITVPQRIGYANASHLREPGAAADVPKAFREYELSGADVHKIERETGFKRESIRRIWNFVILALAMVTLSANAADISAGYSFTPNDRVTSTKLNDLVGAASINTTFATDKSAAQPLAADTILFYQTSSGNWRKTTFDQLLLSNTNLITGQVESDSPTTNDFFLFFDASAGTLAKVPLDGILTNLFLIPNRTLLTNSPVQEQGKLLMYMQDPVQGTGFFSVTWSNLLQYFWRDLRFSTNVASTSPITNPPVITLHTAPTNADMVMIWDAVNQSMKATTLAGLMTNPPVVPEGKLTNADSLLMFSRATNAFGNATGVVAQVAVTNLGHFIMQRYSTTNIIPTATGGWTNLHGLPGVPSYVRAVIVCTNAEFGYMVGDQSWDMVAAGGNGVVRIGANSTNIWLSCANGAATWAVPKRDSAAIQTITKANWNLIVEAYYYP